MVITYFLSVALLGLSIVDDLVTAGWAMPNALRRLSIALERPILNKDELKSALWNGIPENAPLEMRVDAWQLALVIMSIIFRDIYPNLPALDFKLLTRNITNTVKLC